MPGCIFAARPRIVGYKRSPFGRVGGSISKVHPSILAAAVVDATLASSELNPADVSAMVVGHSLPSFCGQHAAQQIVSKSTLLATPVPAISINVVCNSGIEAVIEACRRISVGEGLAYLAVGMESMSRAHMVHSNIATDVATIHDGLLDAETQRSRGDIAEEYYSKQHYPRQQLEAVAVASCEAALARAKPELVHIELDPASGTVSAVTYTARGDSASVHSLKLVFLPPAAVPVSFCEDEQLIRYNRTKLPSLRSCFRDAGLLTSGTTSAMSDGAVAIALVAPTYEGSLAPCEPQAEVLGYFYLVTSGLEYLRAPIDAACALSSLLALPRSDISCIRITEAFAGLVLDIQVEFPDSVVNKNGDALAYGHPLAASSCRIVGDLMQDLEPGCIGLACACNGGGGGYAVCLRRIR